MLQEQIFGGKHCYLYGNGEADTWLIQVVDEYELKILDGEIERIREFAPDTPFSFAALLIKDWNQELSPWEAPAVFGKEAFGAGATDTLTFVTDTLLPRLHKTRRGGNTRFYLGGYSLSGLFALWASCQTAAFCGIAAVSPSVWFPGWDAYMMSHPVLTGKVYLSLGTKEEKTKNKIMSKVGENIREQYTFLCDKMNGGSCILEWNPGNHFADFESRMAKGFAWLLNERE